MGITVMPRTMIPKELEILEESIMPKLDDTHVSILKHRSDNLAVNSLEGFVLRKLKH
jgi:hypothetical protein